MPDTDDLPERPEPHAEPPIHNPGGADAVEEAAPYSAEAGGPLGHDLDPDDNPAVEDALPDEVKQLDDEKTQEPDEEPSDTPEPPA